MSSSASNPARDNVNQSSGKVVASPPSTVSGAGTKAGKKTLVSSSTASGAGKGGNMGHCARKTATLLSSNSPSKVSQGSAKGVASCPAAGLSKSAQNTGKSVASHSSTGSVGVYGGQSCHKEGASSPSGSTGPAKPDAKTAIVPETRSVSADLGSGSQSRKEMTVQSISLRPQGAANPGKKRTLASPNPEEDETKRQRNNSIESLVSDSSVEMVDEEVAAASEAAKSARDSDVRDSDGDWQSVTKKNKEKKLKNTSAKKPDKRLDDSLAVFVTSQHPDFLKQVALKQAKAFKTAVLDVIGDVTKMFATKEAVRIQCRQQQQVEKMLAVESLAGFQVSITLARSVTRKSSAPSVQWRKGVIKRVPLDFTDIEIKEELSALYVKRITRSDDGKITPTRAVIIAFADELPVEVQLGLRDFKVAQFHPKPTRCHRCQKFGHRMANCQAAKPSCPKCGGEHLFDACTETEKKPITCVNCKQEHSPAYKGCRKYQEVSKTLTVATKQCMSYADAAKKLAKEKKQRCQQVASIPPPAAQPQRAQVVLVEAGTQTETSSVGSQTDLPDPSSLLNDIHGAANTRMLYTLMFVLKNATFPPGSEMEAQRGQLHRAICDSMNALGVISKSRSTIDGQAVCYQAVPKDVPITNITQNGCSTSSTV